MLLQVRQLSEALVAHFADKWAFSRVCAYMDLQIGQLTKALVANIALVMYLSIFLLQGEGKGTISPESGSILRLCLGWGWELGFGQIQGLWCEWAPTYEGKLWRYLLR